MTDTTHIHDRALSDADQALDRMLLAARPARDAARDAALLERILAAAERAPRIAAVTRAPLQPQFAHAVTQAPVAVDAHIHAPGRTHRALRANRDWWGSAGIMAASLMIGIIAGQTTFSEQTVRGLEQVTGITLASATLDLASTLAAAEQGEDD
jgi:hypothetical protein